ncbi:MAG: hypothetical protein ACRDZO_07895 [Egibacteraceae bacterium]
MPVVLARQWRTAEERLYQSVMMMEPERYEGYIASVRAIADELSRCHTPDDLVEAYGERSNLAAMAAHRLGSLADPDLVVDAAFNHRYRQIAASARRVEIRERIAAAGAGWLVLQDSPAAGLELHLPSGAGLQRWIEEDIDSGAIRYTVQVRQLDPNTGEEMPNQAPLAGPKTFADPQGWTRAIAELRQRFGQDEEP